MMSSLFSYFGGGGAKKNNSKEAIVKLRQQLEMLRKREIHTEKQMLEQDAIARKNITTNKTVARAALKRKQVLEKNLEVTQQHINTLEQQMNAVETANLNLETIKVMKEASDAMKGMNKRVGINDVDETMEEIRENMQLNKEISEAISSVQITDPEEEEDLETALKELEQQALDDKMISAPAVPVGTHGSAISAKPVAAKPQEEDEEEELRKLQAEMAM
ncbi:Snf7-domain-containing protein [Pyronema domesticum]|uniref:Vacuolar-sorting protein SNF7 n=1 Tax=Pyronema omphalodes (strain CBS 100304) TaxID=1076935 RepID=U4KTW8_PYROM|nr:Snf7-domain-containing protein [Pyronema domesticum]CCX04523.1 Similar to Vacuolar-sorting protein snf-7; acc. no. Q871Y8 [Pyronema omphalodes CBS 100304]